MIDQGDVEEDNDEVKEICLGGEFISVLDPLMLSKIEHPTRCIFCTHNTCFDAHVFFRFQVTSMQWNCPVCLIKIRGIQVHNNYFFNMALEDF